MLIQYLYQFANPVIAGYLIAVSIALYLFTQLGLVPVRAHEYRLFLNTTSMVVLLIGVGALTLWATQSILAFVITDLAAFMSAPIPLSVETSADAE